MSSVVILDYGSQYTRLIARRIRELHHLSLILPGNVELKEIQKLQPKAIILSGGPASVLEPGAPSLPQGFLDYQQKEKIPVLGICYGLQLLVRDLGGKMRRSTKREYGRMAVEFTQSTPLHFGRASFQVWMSHGDDAESLPPGFEILAKSKTGAMAAIADQKRRLYALQFHPEVSHSERGEEILKGFLQEIAGMKADWTMQSVMEEQITRIKKLTQDSQSHVICALSGGVDSTVAAMLVHKAIGDRLHCVFVDHGLSRFEEGNRVMQTFKDRLHLPVTRINAEKEFLDRLVGVTDPEIKRKSIGDQFIKTFESFALGLEKKLGHRPDFLVQGTLYPDVIESSPPPSAGGSAHSNVIKSHHNVGGLPKDLRFQLIEPLRDLFKDEVRELGKVLGVPDNFLKRHPFPGPGLALRVVGEVRRDYLDTLRAADEIFIQALHEFGLYDKIWQAFAAFLPIRSVGVQGDERSYDHCIALRAVTSRDGMTADWYRFDGDFLAEVSSRICNQVKGVNRVVYDISSKPPATIEWE